MPVVVVASNQEVVGGFTDGSFDGVVTAALAGDLYIFNTITQENFPGDKVVTPAGFTVLQDEAFSALATARSWIGWKVAATDAEAASITFTAGHLVPHWASFAVVRGSFDPLVPIVDYTRTEDSSNLATVSYVENDLVLAVMHVFKTGDMTDVTAVPTGFTMVEKARSGSVITLGATNALAKLEAATAGSTAGLSFTWTGIRTGYDERNMVFVVAYQGGTPQVEAATPVPPMFHGRGAC